MRRKSPRRQGFTLVETLVSVATMALLMTGMGSAILIAGNALPNRGNPIDEAIRAVDAVDQISEELRYASAITVAFPTSLAFDVDRNGTAVPIQYAWSGTPGDPLTRIYDGGTSVDLIDDVYEFALIYSVKATSGGAATEVEGGETILKSWDSSMKLSSLLVKNNGWYAQYFKPSLPADAVSWKVTRVQFKASQAGLPGGITMVQLQSAAGVEPTGTILEEYPLNEALLPPEGSFLWQDVAFTNVTGLSPGEGLCLVFATTDATGSCMLEDQSTSVPLSDAALLRSANWGGSWVVSVGGALNFYIYGTVTTTGPPQAGEDRYQSARMSLRTGSNASSRVESAVQILNEPDVP